MQRHALWIDVALKAALVGQLLVAVAFPDSPQFEGKAMTGGAIAYPIAVLIVPAVWWVLNRRRPVAYPYALDILWTLPFLIEVSGNTANLYDTVGWWDDANHFVNWGILVAAFGQLLIRLPLGRLEGLGPEDRLRRGDGDPLGVLGIHHVHPEQRKRAADGLHGHARRPRARSRRLRRRGRDHDDSRLANSKRVAVAG
jgi:hypothetical protein